MVNKDEYNYVATRVSAAPSDFPPFSGRWSKTPLASWKYEWHRVSL